LHEFHKERRRSPRGCFECGDTTHFIVDCPKRNDYSNKGEGKKKYHFRDNNKKKFQKMMS
jgi:hypothetical protein